MNHSGFFVLVQLPILLEINVSENVLRYFCYHARSLSNSAGVIFFLNFFFKECLLLLLLYCC